MSDKIEIKNIELEETLPLRSKILRKGLPYQDCILDTDQQAFHLGAYLNDQLIGIASLSPEIYPDKGEGGYRLRQMGVDTAHAGKGYGALIIASGIEQLIKLNAKYMWCNARTTAVDFYSKLNFEIISDEFEVPGIGPHFDMLLYIKS